MKKKLLLIVSILSILVIFSGCTKEKKEEEKKETLKEIVYQDDKTGYKTVFKFKEDEDYKITDTDTDGKYKEIEIESEKLNIELEIYYTDHYSGGYNTQKENRKNSDGYKEYKWNKYEGYIYNADKHKVDFNILLDDSGDRDIVLFGTMDYKDSKTYDVLESFNSTSFQNFMNSIEFTK